MIFLSYFKVDKKYKYRHEILKYLFTKIKYEPLHNIDLNKSKSSFEEIAKYLNVDVIYLRECHQGLHTFDKDHVGCSNVNDTFFIGITDAGMSAYLDNYWLREGQKELNERIYDKTKWVVHLLALLITFISLLYSVSTIRDINKQVQELKDKINKNQK